MFSVFGRWRFVFIVVCGLMCVAMCGVSVCNADLCVGGVCAVCC